MSQKAEFTGEWIWGDEEETEVYAPGYGADATVIFRFSKNDRRASLANRIVRSYCDDEDGERDSSRGDESTAIAGRFFGDDDEAPSEANRQSSKRYFRRAGRFVGRKVRHALCFSVPESPTQIDVVHHLPDGRKHDAATSGDGGDERGFLSREVMCEHLWAAVDEVWPGVCQSPALKDPAAVVDVDCLDGEQVTWKIVRHPGYSRFLQCLHEGEGDQEWLGKVSSIVKFEDLVRYEGLGGRGCATKVLMGGFRRDYGVFKGLDFRTFMAQKDGLEGSTVKLLIKTWHQSNNIVAIMPPHPNILRPSPTAVTIGSSSGEDRVICGCLYRYMPNGDVGSSLEKALEQHTRLPLETKKKWDIKPGNFLLDDDGNLVLIHWEHSDAPATTLAPKADGTWDVEEVLNPAGETRALVYQKYTGPKRRNVDVNAPGDRTWNSWNVFPIWSKEHSRALELAEVFSVGRSMWMLLRQPVDMEFDGVEHPNDLFINWEGADDIPADWKATIERCLAKDPNQRPDLERLREMVVAWNDGFG